MSQKRAYRILLDGTWSLEDLTVFTRIYFQNYSFVYCLDNDDSEKSSERLDEILEDYELRHGLSYVHIYSIFKDYVPTSERPKIQSIQYNSPGWLDLVLNGEVAIHLAKVIGIYLGSAIAILEVYKKLYKIYSDLNTLRKEKKIQDLKLENEELQEVRKLNEELAQGLGFQNLKQLNEKTKDPEETSKLLMAHFRRIRKITEFVRDGKVNFPERLKDE